MLAFPGRVTVAAGALQTLGRSDPARAGRPLTAGLNGALGVSVPRSGCTRVPNVLS